jgi:DNA-binding NarL/FixJ family response regulator
MLESFRLSLIFNIIVVYQGSKFISIMGIKIGIVDDHPLLIKGLKAMLMLQPDMEIIASYANGEELWKGLNAQVPDVLLLDIQIPGQTGDELTPILHQKYPQMKILALTHMKQDYFIKALLSQGAMGYVLKSSPENVLLEAIREVAAGVPYYDPEIRIKAREIMGGVDAIPLISRREKEVLELVAQSFSSQEIADRLFLSKRTVDRHRENLFLKLEVKNMADLVKKAMDLGVLR